MGAKIYVKILYIGKYLWDLSMDTHESYWLDFAELAIVLVVLHYIILVYL